jgi:hypothetical protein
MRPSKLQESLDAAASISPLLRFENFVIAAFIVLAAVLSSGCEIRFATAQAGEVSPGGSDAGQLVYDLNCAVCHGVQGATAMGPRHPCFSRDRAIFVPASSNFVRRLRAHCPLTRTFCER